MDASRERGISQNEYSYVQGGKESQDTVYVRTYILSLRVLAIQMC